MMHDSLDSRFLWGEGCKKLPGWFGTLFSHVEMGIPVMVQVKMGNCFLQEMVKEASIAPRVPA